MRDLALLAIVLASIPYILKRPYWGLIMWVVFSLMNPHRLTYGFAFGLPFAMVIAVLTLSSLAFNSKRLYRFPVNGSTVSMILLVLWINVSPLLSQHTAMEYVLWDRAIKIMIMVLITFWVVGKREELHYLAWALALSIGFYGIKGGVFTLAHGGEHRVWGPAYTFIEDNNAMALAIVMAVPLFRYLQLHTPQRWLRNACLGGLLLCVASAVGSHSRGALLALGGMSVFLWLKSRNKAAIGVAAIVLGMVILFNMPDAWIDRMKSIGEYKQDASAMGRINAWVMTWNLAVDHFPFGGGFDIYTWENFARYAPNPLDLHAAHSIYFQILGEHGFIGLAIFLAVFISAWRSGSWVMRSVKKLPEYRWAYDLAAMSQVSLVGYATGGAFLSLSYYDFPYYVASMLIITRLIVARELQAAKAEAVAKAKAAVEGTAGQGAQPALGGLRLRR